MPLFEVVYWVPQQVGWDAITEEFDDKYEAQARLLEVCHEDPERVGFVFSVARNKRIMSIGVGLD